MAKVIEEMSVIEQYEVKIYLFRKYLERLSKCICVNRRKVNLKRFSVEIKERVFSQPIIL